VLGNGWLLLRTSLNPDYLAWAICPRLPSLLNVAYRTLEKGGIKKGYGGMEDVGGSSPLKGEMGKTKTEKKEMAGGSDGYGYE